jgi:hypothetical protein
MSSDSEIEQGLSFSKRQKYDLKFRLDAVKYAEEHDKSKAAKKFKVDARAVDRFEDEHNGYESDGLVDFENQ